MRKNENKKNNNNTRGDQKVRGKVLLNRIIYIQQAALVLLSSVVMFKKH